MDLAAQTLDIVAYYLSITTGDEGTGEGIFTIQPNTVGNVFAFDSYPEGAPAGNKMQSTTVRLQ